MTFNDLGRFPVAPRRQAAKGEPRKGRYWESTNMSNMNDAIGLCVPYGKANSQYETQFEPATGTVWGYFNPRGTACYSLGLLKDILAHDQQLVANQARVELGDAWHEVNYYVTGSRGPCVFNLGGDLTFFLVLIKTRYPVAVG